MRKRIIAFIFTFILSFSVVSMDYIDARANEFVLDPPVYATTGVGLLSLMAVSGVLPELAMLGAFTTVSALGAYTVTLFTSYAADKADIDTATVDNWLENLQNGIIDTSSSIYGLYKEWLTDLVSTSIVSDGNYKYTLNGTDSVYYLNDYTYITAYPNKAMDLYFFIASPTNNIADTNNMFYIVSNDYINTLTLRGYYDDKKKGSFSRFNDAITKTYISNGNTYYINRHYISSNNYGYGEGFSYTPTLSGSYSNINFYNWYQSIMIEADSFEEAFQKVLNPPTTDWNNLGGLIGDGVSVPDLSDLPLSGSDSISMNLENVVEKLGSLEEALEKVLGRDISITDYQDATGVYVVDNDNVVTVDKDIPITDYAPNPEFAPDKTVTPDKPQYNDSEFTVQGLKEVFPFCIPFDLIDFINSLKADPVAPRWTLSASFLGERFASNSIVIDLSKYNSLAALCRKTELLLFIISLILITRNIIKG